MNKTKTVTCNCGNVVTCEAHTEPDSKTVYGFASHFKFTGAHQHDLIMGVVHCNQCTLQHDFEPFCDKFHRLAIKQSQAAEAGGV